MKFILKSKKNPNRPVVAHIVKFSDYIRCGFIAYCGRTAHFLNDNCVLIGDRKVSTCKNCLKALRNIRKKSSIFWRIWYWLMGI